MSVLINYKDVSVSRQEFEILKGIDLEIHKGEFVYLIGKVGTGKSSFFRSLYAEFPLKGSVAKVLNYDLLKLKNKHIPFLRRKIGIVFQDFQLLTDRSVDENLEFVLRATGWTKRKAIQERINVVLGQVGMQNKGYKMPHQLSGGEQQRVVIARALLNAPEVIIADEPTGNLDPETGIAILSLLHEICRMGTTVLMSTHNHVLTRDFPGRIICFDNHQISEVVVAKSPQQL